MMIIWIRNIIEIKIILTKETMNHDKIMTTKEIHLIKITNLDVIQVMISINLMIDTNPIEMKNSKNLNKGIQEVDQDLLMINMKDLNKRNENNDLI